MNIVSDYLLSVATHGLVGSTATFPDAPLDPVAWKEVMRGVRNERLSGFLVDAIAGQHFPVTQAQFDQLREHHTAAMAHALRLERLLVQAVDRLTAAGIEHRVLKGAAISHLDYRAPAMRPFGDVDLLVPEKQHEEAVATLCAGDLRVAPSCPERPRPCGGRGIVLRADDGCEIDLYRRLVGGPFGAAIPPSAPFSPGTPWQLGGTRLVALDREARLVHACYVAATCGGRLLLPLRDIAELLLATDVDQVQAEQLSLAWHGAVLMAHGITLAWQTLRLADVVRLSVWAARYPLGAADVKALRAYSATPPRPANRREATIRHRIKLPHFGSMRARRRV